MIKAVINGKEAEVKKDSTLAEIISLYKLNPERVVAEVNGNVLTRDKYADTLVNNGDKVELINFVGGG
ncbi:sulfur carrier protein ThiS [Geovibrio sp. ADMFC3]|jgi:thiamine biosynthesis protein ThiS